MPSFALIVAALLCVVAAASYPPPPPTFQAADWTTWQPTAVNGSRRANVAVKFAAPDGTADVINLIRLDLLGDSFARGFAHGSLIANEIVQFAADLEPFFDASGTMILLYSFHPT